MIKNIKELYYNYQAIRENLTYFGTILKEDFDKLEIKLRSTKKFYENVNKIVNIIKEYSVEDELNESNIKDINEQITQRLLSLGYVSENENGDIKLNIDKNEQPVKNIDELYSAIRNSERNKRFLYNNAVVNTVTSYEQFIGFIIKLFYTNNSESINGKSLTLKEIKELGGLDEAVDYLICREVKDKMYGSVNDWQKTMQTSMNIDIKHYCDNKACFTEVFQRRHLIVHNSSMVNGIYLKEVKDSNYHLDDIIESDFEYVIKIQKVLIENAFVIAINASSKLIKHEEELQNTLLTIGQLAFEMMKNNNWETSQIIYDNLKNNKNLCNEYKTMYQLNSWLCEVNLFGDSIIEKIKECDFSDKSNFLKIGYYSLIMDKEILINLFKENSNLFDIEALVEWPIFFKVRQDKDLYNSLIEIISK